MLTTQTMLWMWKCLQRKQQILRYIREHLEALQLQKSICAFAQFKVFAQRVVPLFLISCAVSAHQEEVNVWSASHARYITHKVVQKYFLQCKTSLGFSGNPQWKMAHPALFSSVQPYISLIAHSYQLRHKAFPIRGRYQSQRRHLHPGQERLIFILICKGRLPTHTIIVNEGIMWWWKYMLFLWLVKWQIIGLRSN